MGIFDILDSVVKCPNCGSTNVKLLKCDHLGSGFGIGKGKAKTCQYKCLDCKKLFVKRETDEGEIGSSKCYITTATFIALNICDDNCSELQKFRWYRDNILIKEPDGKELIEEYYRTAPLIVQKLEELPNKEEVYKQIWDKYLSKCLQFLDKKQFTKVKETYVEMVRTLRKKFLIGE